MTSSVDLKNGESVNQVHEMISKLSVDEQSI